MSLHSPRKKSFSFFFFFLKKKKKKNDTHTHKSITHLLDERPLGHSERGANCCEPRRLDSKWKQITTQKREKKKREDQQRDPSQQPATHLRGISNARVNALRISLSNLQKRRIHRLLKKLNGLEWRIGSDWPK
jgi:hypothetical protein